MGARTRPKPKLLSDKLRRIRLTLGLSQNELVERLGGEESIVRSTISAFERGTREPSYPVLLRYAKLAGVSTDFLIDDDLELVIDV